MCPPEESIQKKVRFLIENKDSYIFDQWEKNFIRDIKGKRSTKYTLNDRIVIHRLIGFFYSSQRTLENPNEDKS